jgi:molybdate transport repressor ModE-like protein
MPPLLDLDLLRALVAVNDCGSINRAAAHLGRSQAAASAQLRRLEMLVGRPLLHRTARGSRFTASGEVLLRHARRILDLHDAAWTELLEPDVSGVVRLGLPDDYAEMLLPPLLQGFAARHPLVLIEIVCEPTPELRARMSRGDLDVALFTESLGSLTGRELRREDLLWSGTSKGPTPWMSDPLPLALCQPEAPDRVAALAALSAAGRSWRVLHESGSAAGLIAVVRAGVAVAVFSRCAVPSDLRVLGRAEGMPDLPSLAIVLHAATRPPSPAAGKLADYISAELPLLSGKPDG